MFGKKASPANGREYPRHNAGKMSVTVDGVQCKLLDYSDGGVRVSIQGALRRVALIEIHKNGKCIRKTPAIIAWRRDSETGYAFRSNLKIYEVDKTEHRATAEKSVETETNDSGSLSGSTLRARLRM